MNAEDLARRLEGKWSTAQILEHLYLSYSGTVKGFKRCLDAGKPLARAPMLKDRMRAFVVTGLGHMPTGRQSPERTRPRGMTTDEVMSGIAPQIVAMDEVIAQCEARFGKRTCLLDHPVLGPLTGRQWRKFHWVHGCHHIKQIEKLRRHSHPAGLP
jgi:hypothetical protein